MADTENDILIDGKSIYSLRVVDLKQELKKRDIPFKTNATKAQLQSLLIPHLSQTVDAIEDKSSEDNSRLTTHSEDTNETIESNPEVINTNTIDDNKPNDVQTEATDLSQDSGITSSVSFGDRQSIKLTIKLGPNDSPIKQLSPKKSPTKEMRSPVIVEEVKTMIEEIKTKPIDVIPDVVPLIEDQGIPKTESTTKVETLPVEDVIEQNNESNSQVKSPQKSDNIEEKEEKQEIITEVPKQEAIAEVPKQEVIAEVPKQEVIAEVPKQEVIAEVPKQEVIAEVPKQEVIAEVPKQEVIAEVPKQEVIAEVPKQEVIAEVPKPDEIVESIPEIETSKPMDLSSVDSNELQKKPEEKTETIEDNLSIPVVSNDKEVVSDTIVISEEISEELAEQKTEPSISSSEKESLNSVQSSSEDKAKDLPSDESLISTQSELNPQKEDIIEKKSVGKENKIEESEDKPEIIKKPEQPKEEKPKPPRRRRWGGSTANETQQNTRKGISSDQLKDLIPDLNSADNSNTASKVSKSDSIVVTSSLSRTQTAEEITEIPAKRDIRVVRKSVSVAEEQTSVTEETVKIPQTIVEQKAKIVVESEPEPKVSEAEVIREVSPPQKAESNIVFIRNLVRPFTLLQLKEVLGKTGKLTEERFWIDKIKSKCFASYQTNEEAVATRLALHGTRWPSSNPKLLIVDFATKEELDSHLEPDLNKDITNKKTDNEVNQKYDIVIRSEEQRNVLREKDNRNENRPIREWDREKLVNKEDDKKARRRPNSPITRSRSRERDPKRRRIGEERVRPADSTSEEAPATEAVKRTESPAKLLDDLFRKTTATPSIYWLPLTEEQALARVVIREEEEKKRAEERTAREEQFRKRQEDRRPFEANSPPFRNERNQWRPDSSPNRRMFGRRGSAPRRSPPGRRSPPRRRSPINRFSRSRSRSPFPRRKR